MQNYSGIIALILYIIGLVIFLRYEANHSEEEKEETKENKVETSIKEALPLDTNDEDATVACLVAAIECRNEYHKNVQIVSVRRID